MGTSETRSINRTRDETTQSIYVVRNEVDPAASFHCDALTTRLPDTTVVDFTAGERFDPADADAVVLSGSTASISETTTYPWISDQKTLIRDLVTANVPTLGICFGHQIVNAALGGVVKHAGMTAGLVEATPSNDPLFDGVEPIVPVLHGDVVVTPGIVITRSIYSLLSRLSSITSEDRVFSV